MERFSNRIEALMSEAEIEIENFDLKDGENIIAYISESPSISGFPYKIILVKNSDGIVYSRFRQWDTEYDFTRWDNGIYNLDRLRIITEENLLSETDITNLKEQFLKLETLELPDSIQNEKALALDPSTWKFGVSLANKNVDYTWKIATKDINLFRPIMDLMRKHYLDRV